MTKGSHFVLVHGAGHGAWCWYKTVDLLQKAGHKATAVDLTSAGISTIHVDNVESIDHYNQPLTDLIESLPEDEKIILVGHSLGGISLGRMSEVYPHKIAAAIYVSAVILPSGVPNSEQEGSPLFQRSRETHFGRGDTNPPTSWTVSKGALKDVFYNTSPSEDVALATMLLRPVPLFGTSDATIYTTERYGSVPKVFVKASKDHCILPETRDMLISDNKMDSVLELEGSDHSPFFSTPQALHRHLVHVAATYDHLAVEE